MDSYKPTDLLQDVASKLDQEPSTIESIILFTNIAVQFVELLKIDGLTKKELVLDTLDLLILHTVMSKHVRAFIRTSVPILIDTLVAAYNSDSFIQAKKKAQSCCWPRI